MVKGYIRWHVLFSLGLLAFFTSTVNADGAFSSKSKWGLGDWNSRRTALSEQGYDFMLYYVGEFAGNLDGGYNNDKTTRYTSQWAIGAHLDLQKILSWQDAEFQLTLTERSGNNLSNERIGDPRTGQLSSVQEVWGRGQTWRLTQMWYKQKFFDGALDVKIGRFGEENDFNSFPCNFQSLAFCAAPVGNLAGDIWYSWPVSQWALRLRYNLNAQWYTQVGIFEQNPTLLEKDNGFKLNTSGIRGILLPFEVVWQPNFGEYQLPGTYRLGYYYSTAKANDVYEDINGQPQALTGKSFKSHSNKYGWWFGAQQQVSTHNGDASRGLSLFANFTIHDQATSRIDSFQQFGMVYKGLFDARPKDELGLGLARLHINDDVSKYQRQINRTNGLDDYDNPSYQPVQHAEYNMELHYGMHVTNWLIVRPNLQYVRHPGGVNEVDNALVVAPESTI